MSWKLATMSLAISYIYYIYRLSTHFGELPITVYTGMSFAVISYAFHGYCVSKMFKKEFLALYKADESSKAFKHFLNNLPEGVSIINDSTSELKFMNTTLKKVFSLKTYTNNIENIAELNRIQEDIDREFDE
mmetsp:Transcript_2419/g.2092  ORF Transcript_2419/g.2092 Transcript_2419/m.2092 type:complete len:132 (+) Transcript_2419:410-805(+)